MNLQIAIPVALIYFVPFRRLQRSVGAEDWPKAGSAFGWIRGLMAVNLRLDLTAMLIAAAGPAVIAG
jgi:uncharacterized membrane protein